MSIEENPFEHILYEFSMYLRASLIRCNIQLITNLLVDSRLVHMRNLAYFFRAEKEGKSYLHYSMYLSERLSAEIDDRLFHKIQAITSNATCHLQKGRLKHSFKEETYRLELDVLPRFVFLIQEFLQKMEGCVRPEHASAWTNEQIQAGVADIMNLINTYKASGGKIMYL